MASIRDHGGGLDAAILRFGGTRSSWVDLSTGINPMPYPFTNCPPDAWTALPDVNAQSALENAARRFWNIPLDAAVLAAPGASCLIANMPYLVSGKSVQIQGPTYNEHAAAFDQAGWDVRDAPSDARVIVNPNNPDGRIWQSNELGPEFTIIDESFCDIAPEQSMIAQANQPERVILKSFGKFWGLAGLRLGFAIGPARKIDVLRARLGPWPVSGPALHIGAQALNDTIWAKETRARLEHDSMRLDALMQGKGAKLVGGTTLFRLYDVGDAQAWQDKLAGAHIWSRIFPYSTRWLRLGLPHPMNWARIEDAL
jgi:cobalamin biosynthetic protein CobC